MNIQGENKTQNRIFSLLPLWIVIGIFMIGPLLVMAVVSLMESNVYGGVHFKLVLVDIDKFYLILIFLMKLSLTQPILLSLEDLLF